MKPICIINSYGDKTYYLNNKFHREDGPAIEYHDGIKLWYLNGELHREDGPAFDNSIGTKKWFLNDILHREDGPAIEWSDGFKAWYYHGNLIDCKDNQEFLRMIKLMAFL
tara:strand:- start:11312 stop:11641 length:330 start_codon:yes stop_codon:yes gene_type:complete